SPHLSSPLPNTTSNPIAVASQTIQHSPPSSLQVYRRTPHRTVLTFPSLDPEPVSPSSSRHSSPSATSRVRPSTTHSMVTRAKTGVHKPNPKYANHAFLASTNDIVEPTCFSQANKFQEWRTAMGEECNALQQAGTWVLVPPKPTLNVLLNKWVFRIKHNSDGSVQRYKARLVANGFHQQEWLDYGETFSPVVNHSTICLILALSVQFQWPVHQLDVQNTFLHGYLNEEVYMRQPTHPQFPDHLCHLKRSLYGLKQAPRAWFKCFSTHLEDLGFTASTADSSLFIYLNGFIRVYLLIYVDDILITGNDSAHISTLIQDLSRLFSMKDLGPVHYFLGMEILRTPSGLSFTQSKYIKDLLTRRKMQDAKHISSPVASGRRLSLHDGAPLDDPSEYRSVV
ncbi:PREDICTED: Retrovirus-related Pol poly from, partial [Prunus dulcis]